MGIATIRKLLPNDSNVLFLDAFLREYAPGMSVDALASSVIDDETNDDLPEELRKMIIAPSKTCKILASHNSRDERATNNRYNNYNYNYKHNNLHRSSLLLDDNNTNKNTNKNNKNNIHHYDCHSRCRESVRAIVDDVVYSLVQRREALRCKRNHERKRPRKRKRIEDRNVNSIENNSNNYYYGTNVLIHGFGVSKEGDPSPPFGREAGVSYKHPNENVTFCKSSPIFKQLHELVGDEILRMILLHTRCFLPIVPMVTVAATVTTLSRSRSRGKKKQKHYQGRPIQQAEDTIETASNNDCDGDGDGHNYILLCGPPIPYDSNRLRATKPLTNGSGARNSDNIPSIGGCTNQKNKKKSKKKQKQQRQQRRSFPTLLAEGSPLGANESISRFSLLYCDSYVPRVTLPISHPFPKRLERQKQQYQKQKHHQQKPPVAAAAVAASASGIDTDDYGFFLNVVFELHLENRNKQRRIRKRLGGAGKRVLCEQLWKNYSSCHDYGRLLEKYCPLPDVYHEVRNTKTKPTMSSLPYNDTSAATSAAATGNESDTLAKLAHAYAPKEGIVSFLASVLKRVFPNDFWGKGSNSNNNFRSFLTSVRSFVHLRRHEKLTNKNLMHKISVTAMEWLYPCIIGASPETDKSESETDNSNVSAINTRKRKPKYRKERTNHETATELTLQAFRWVFKGFIIPLLRSCFYVTETEFDARELHYYRKPVWAIFRAFSFQKLTTAGVNINANANTNDTPNHHRQFRILSHSQAKQCLKQQQMGISKLRLLPKATGMRPIAQLSRSARFEFPTTTKAVGATKSMAPAKSEKESSDHKQPRIEIHPLEESRPRMKRKLEDHVNIAIGSSTEDISPIKSELLPSSLSPPPPPPPMVISRIPTNTILEKVLDVLTYECNQRHRPYGNGLGNLREFYVRYRDSMARFQKWQPSRHNGASSGDSKPQKIFFAKVDIEQCYDRIHQDYLLELVQGLVSHNTYVMQTIKMDCASFRGGVEGGGENAVRFKKVVEPIEDYHSFHHREHSLAKQHQNTVFELLRCSLVEQPKILHLLRQHLLQHIVVATGRHEHKLLLQSRGISQGSTLSMLLCNLYYGRVEELMLGRRQGRKIVPPCTNPASDGETRLQGWEGDAENDLMSRFVDDFLFVSPNEASFRRFLDKTHKGKPELGARINPSKTLVSEEASVKVPAEEGGTQTISLSRSNRTMNNDRHLFPWCGLLFDTVTGEVLVDYERFRDGKLRRSLTIDSDGSEGKKLAQRLKAFLFPRCLPILYDASINSFATATANFYQMMLFGACKTGEYIRGLNTLQKRPPHKIHNDEYLLKCIRELSTYAIKNIRSKSRARDDRAIDIHPKQVFHMDPRIASTLSLKAFCDVFSYLWGFGTVARSLKDESMVLLEGFPRKKREELRKITARALDDFRINNMIEK